MSLLPKLCWLLLSLFALPGLGVPDAQAQVAKPAPPVLRLGGFTVAPLMMGEAGEPLRGALPDFIRREIAPQTKLRFVWLPSMSFARALRSLRDGSLDVLLMYGADGSKGNGISRFDWAYLHTGAHLAVVPDSQLLKIDALEQLRGLEIGWLSGSQMPQELRELGIHWQLASGQNWQTVNLRKLQAGRLAAAYYANPYSPSYIARKNGIAIRLLPLPMPARSFTMAYSLKTDPARLAEFEGLAVAAFKGERFKQFLEQYRD